MRSSEGKGAGEKGCHDQSRAEVKSCSKEGRSSKDNEGDKEARQA